MTSIPTTFKSLPYELISMIGLYIKPEYIGLALLSIRPLADFFRPAAGLEPKYRDCYVAYHQDRAEPASKGRETDATHFLGHPHGQITTNHPDYIFTPKNITLYSFGKVIKSVDFCPQTGNISKFTTPTRISHYFENGELCRVDQIKDGKLHGNTIRYKKKGRISNMAQYRDGLLHGEFTYYYEETGKIMSSATFINGHEEGFHIVYYPNGKIMRVISYKNNNRNGMASYFHKDHELKGKEIGIHIMRALGCCPVPPGLFAEAKYIGGWIKYHLSYNSIICFGNKYNSSGI